MIERTPWLLGGLALATPLLTSLPNTPLSSEAQRGSQTAEEEERVWVAEIGKPAPRFELTDTDGKTWELGALQDKVVVLEWFNPTCPVVVKAHEEGPLQTLGNEACAAHDDTVWLAVNSGAPGTKGQGNEANQAARAQWALEYPVLIDESGATGAAYQATTTPHMFVIDGSGRLVFAGHHDDVAAALEDVWAGREVAKPRTKNEGCSVKYASRAELGLVTPDFALVDIHTGESVQLSSLRGQPVVLEWFNPQCPFVVRAHGDEGSLNSCAAKWSEQDVAWIAINSGAPGKQGTGVELNKESSMSWGMQHPLLLDEEGKVGRAYGATNTPQMFVLDPSGVLVYTGACDDEAGKSYVDAALSELLAGKPVSTPRTKAYGCSVKY